MGIVAKQASNDMYSWTFYFFYFVAHGFMRGEMLALLASFRTPFEVCFWNFGRIS